MTDDCLEKQIGLSRRRATLTCKKILSAQAKTLKAGSEVSIPIEICEYIAAAELGVERAWDYIRVLEEQAGALTQIAKDAEEYFSRLEALLSSEHTDEVIALLREEDFTGVTYQ